LDALFFGGASKLFFLVLGAQKGKLKKKISKKICSCSCLVFLFLSVKKKTWLLELWNKKKKAVAVPF